MSRAAPRVITASDGHVVYAEHFSVTTKAGWQDPSCQPNQWQRALGLWNARVPKTMEYQKMLRRTFPYLKRPDVEFVLDCTSFIFFSVIFLHWVAHF